MAGKVLFLGVSLRVLPEKIDIWVSGLGEEDSPSMWVGTIQLAASTVRTKQAEEGETCLPSLLVSFFFPRWMLVSAPPALGHQTPGSPALWTLRLAPTACWGLLGLWLQTEGCTVSFPGFEAFGLRLSHYWLFSFPACRRPIMGLCLVIMWANSP